MNIRAPFNFVPLSDKVFFPTWAEQISHDIPFEDGESGEITLKITAKTPIFVRNGHNKGDAENKNDHYKSFSKVDDRYFIPATSIKGAIRNVLEILSFGKLKVDQRMKFAVRDWDNPDVYPLKNIKEQKAICCGWLRPNGDNYEIIDCGKPYRINHKRIDEYLVAIGKEAVLESKFGAGRGFNLNEEYSSTDGKKYDPKTACFKYSLVEINDLREVSFVIDDEYCTQYAKTRLQYSPAGEIVGDIVFAGQPDQWVFPRRAEGGKFYEFVFATPKKQTGIAVSKKTFDEFKFIYEESEDWEYYKKRLNHEGIPVFFRKDDNDISDFGLAYMYKLPYKNTPYELLGGNHKEAKPDMAESIFGYTSLGNDSKKSMKGRVQFSHAFTVGDAITDEEIRLVLASPKASYYPMYVEQSGNKGFINGNYATYNQNNSRLNGWKRYPVRSNIWGNSMGDNVDSILTPLKSGTAFECKLRFHNLKRAEIGALLSALTFHNSVDCYHQLGQAKAYGYGKVKVEIIKNTLSLPLSDYLGWFEVEVSDGLKSLWCNQSQIKELLVMAKDRGEVDDAILKYMTLEMDGTNDFVSAKQLNEYLQRFSDLSNCEGIGSISPQTYYTRIKPKQQEEHLLKEMAKEQAVKEERERLEQAAKDEQARLEHEFEQKRQEEERLRQQNKTQKAEEALSSGLDISAINLEARDAWERVDKLIKRFICKVYKMNDYSRISKDACPLLPESEREKVVRAVERIYASGLPKKEKEKWDRPFEDNPIMRKLVEYVGVEAARKTELTIKGIRDEE